VPATTHPSGTDAERQLRDVAAELRRRGAYGADELDRAIDDLVSQLPNKGSIMELSHGERVVLALSYAAGALSRKHHPGPGMIEDDQRFSRELLQLLPFVMRLIKEGRGSDG
jgi:hypothetical protein